MKKHSFYRPVVVAAGLFMAVTATSADAQEYIVSEQVVSDVAYDGGDSFVGDLSADDAGVVYQGGTSIPGGRSYGRPDLFYNYYSQGGANTSNAQLYVSPLPTPAHVGHTHYTYQPFHPDELLYAHKDRYHQYYDNGRGLNRTKVNYYYPPVRQAASNFYWNYLRLPR